MSDEAKIERPTIPTAEVNELTSPEEQFQNETLRPVIKMKHELLIAFFNQVLKAKKNQYFKISEEKRSDYVRSIFNNDLQFRNQLKGIIIGQFSIKEFKSYSTLASAINKRIVGIALERVLTHLDQLSE